MLPGGEGGKEKPYKMRYTKDATNAEQSKIPTLCKGACINYMRILLAIQQPKATSKVNQAQKRNTTTASTKTPTSCQRTKLFANKMPIGIYA